MNILQSYLINGELVIQNILDEKLEPYFAQKDYEGGVKAAFASFYSVLDTYYDKNPVKINSEKKFDIDEEAVSEVIGKCILIAIVFIALLAIYAFSNRGRGRRSTTSYDSYSYGSGYGRRRRRHHHHMPPPPPRHHHHGHRSSFGGGGPHRGPGGLGPGPSSRGSSVGRSAPSRSASPSPSRSSGRSTGVSSGGGGSTRSGSGAGRSSGAGRGSSGAGRRK